MDWSFIRNLKPWQFKVAEEIASTGTLTKQTISNLGPKVLTRIGATAGLGATAATAGVLGLGGFAEPGTVGEAQHATRDAGTHILAGKLGDAFDDLRLAGATIGGRAVQITTQNPERIPGLVGESVTNSIEQGAAITAITLAGVNGGFGLAAALSSAGKRHTSGVLDKFTGNKLDYSIGAPPNPRTPPATPIPSVSPYKNELAPKGGRSI